MYSGVLNVLSFISNLYMTRQLIFFEAMCWLVDYVVLLFRCSGFTTFKFFGNSADVRITGHVTVI